MNLQTRINVPSSVTKGEVVEVRTLIAHPQETGFRRGAQGEVLERDIIDLFVCEFEGIEVFRVDMQPGIAANPYLSFFVRADRSGRLTFRWRHQSGAIQEEQADLTVA